MTIISIPMTTNRLWSVASLPHLPPRIARLYRQFVPLAVQTSQHDAVVVVARAKSVQMPQITAPIVHTERGAGTISASETRRKGGMLDQQTKQQFQRSSSRSSRSCSSSSRNWRSRICRRARATLTSSSRLQRRRRGSPNRRSSSNLSSSFSSRRSAPQRRRRWSALAPPSPLAPQETTDGSGIRFFPVPPLRDDGEQRAGARPELDGDIGTRTGTAGWVVVPSLFGASAKSRAAP